MTGPSWPRALVCDLDGTVIDSLPDIAAAINATFAADGRPLLDEAAVRLMIGSGARVLLRRAMEAQGEALDEAALETLFGAFLEHYAQAAAQRSRMYDGAEVVLGSLRQDGVALAICTNKPQTITDIVVRDMALDRWFGSIIGVSDVRPRKPDPAMLLAALDELGVPPEHAMMIGDSGTDIKTAKAAGIPVVVVTFGYSREDVRTLGADHVIDRWDELPAVMRRLSAAKGG